MSEKGKYVLSQRRGRGTRPFDHEGRETFTDSFRKGKKGIPGPGTYEKPSDFGVYGDVGYYKSLSLRNSWASIWLLY